MKKPYYISPISNNDKLIKKLKVGDYVEYSLIYKKTKIREMFEGYNVDFVFCQPGSRECINFGPAVIKITSIGISDVKDVKQIKPTMFDPKMLAI